MIRRVKFVSCPSPIEDRALELYTKGLEVIGEVRLPTDSQPRWGGKGDR